jgi:hypothetical protein
VGQSLPIGLSYVPGDIVQSSDCSVDEPLGIINKQVGAEAQRKVAYPCGGCTNGSL